MCLCQPDIGYRCDAHRDSPPVKPCCNPLHCTRDGQHIAQHTCGARFGQQWRPLEAVAS